jgi:[citrate (pro-3S)-lyase] ligase
MYDVYIEEFDLSKRAEIENFLSPFEIELEADVEYSLVARSEGEILGSCSSSGNIIKSLAVRCSCGNSGIGSKLVTHMMNHLFDRGIYDVFVFTKKTNTEIFKDLGFREIVSSDKVVLMENSRRGIEAYVEKMFIKSGLGTGSKASIVMNCNPVTNGHLHLIKKASEENEQVVVFIVEEDKSLFSFETRLELVRKCTREMKNVHVIPGGSYIISSNTFPSYFLREEEKSAQYMEIDLKIFGQYIGKVFNIDRRYVGTEPYCNMTGSYNEGMKKILPGQGIEIVELERHEMDGNAISASMVRQKIKEDRIEDVRNLVCREVYEYLISEEAGETIERIKGSDSLH